MAAEVGHWPDLAYFAGEAVRRYGRIDTWIHTAPANEHATVEQIEVAERQRIIEVNLMGQIYGSGRR